MVVPESRDSVRGSDHLQHMSCRFWTASCALVNGVQIKIRHSTAPACFKCRANGNEHNAGDGECALRRHAHRLPLKPVKPSSNSAAEMLVWCGEHRRGREPYMHFAAQLRFREKAASGGVVRS